MNEANDKILIEHGSLFNHAMRQIGARLTYGSAWLVYDGMGEWAVYDRPYGSRKNRTLYVGGSLTTALHELLGDDAEPKEDAD